MATQEVLSQGFIVRPPTMDDAELLAALINVSSFAEGDQADQEAEGIRNDWQAPGFDLATQAWMVFTAQGQLVGYEEVSYDEDEHLLDADGYVHPDYINQGIGTYLLTLVDEQARIYSTRNSVPVRVQVGIGSANQQAHQLFDSMGYRVVRNFWRMQIEMQEPPPTTLWPEGIVIRPFIYGQDDEAVYRATQEAFEDHWGHTSVTYEEWYHSHVEREDFDPSLWFVALEGDEVAGAIISRLRGDNGWVRTLAVRRPWRQRGLGMALLLTAFGTFYQRGIPVVGLGVDTENLTGATRLYERAGMQPIVRYDTCEKTVSA